MGELDTALPTRLFVQCLEKAKFSINGASFQRAGVVRMVTLQVMMVLM